MHFSLSPKERSETHFKLTKIWRVPSETDTPEHAARAAMAELVAYHANADHWWSIGDAVLLADEIGYISNKFKHEKQVDHVVFDVDALVRNVGCPTLARLAIQLCGAMAREDHFGAAIWTDAPASEPLPGLGAVPSLASAYLPEQRQQEAA